MVSSMVAGLAVVSLLVAQGSCTTHYPSLYTSTPRPQPLAVIADSPYSVAKYSINVPLVVVDRSSLQMIRDPKISAVSPTEPLVTFRTSNHYYTEATPAVRVVLKEPLYVEPHQHLIPFPAELSVLYGGLRMGLPVGSVIAPVPHRGYNQPHLIRVVYAVPSGPLPIQYPYYDPFAYSSPVYPQRQFLPVATFQQNYSPSFYNPLPSRPVPLLPSSDVSNVIVDMKQQKPQPQSRPQPPQVTVLDFPSSVATPEVLYYQPPLDDSELGNRGPPEAIIPAGIVQSTQPVASLESFLNSKESPILEALREQAEKNKDKEAEGVEGVEAL